MDTLQLVVYSSEKSQQPESLPETPKMIQESRIQELDPTLTPVLQNIASESISAVDMHLLDKDMLLSRVDNDVSFLSKLITMFNQAIPAHLNNIETAIQTEDAGFLEEQAHALKGAISNFTEKSPFEVAKTMEGFGKNKDFSSAPKTFIQLKSEIQHLQEELQHLL